MYAAKSGSMAAVMLLLDAGEPLQARDVHGRSALSLAVLSGNEAVMQLLIDCGADSKVVDDEGNDLVRLASKAGRYGPLRLALQMAQRNQKVGSNGTGSEKAPMENAVKEAVSASTSPNAGRSASVSTSDNVSARTPDEASTCSAPRPRSPSLSAIVQSSPGGMTPKSRVRSLASMTSASHSRTLTAMAASDEDSDDSLEFVPHSPATTQPLSLSFDQVAAEEASKGGGEGTPVSAPMATAVTPGSASSSSSEEVHQSWQTGGAASNGQRLMMPPRWTPARNGFPVTPGSNATSWVASSLHKHMVAASSPRPQRADHSHVTPGLLNFNVMDNPLVGDTPPSAEMHATQQGWNGMGDNYQMSASTESAQRQQGETPFWIKGRVDSPGDYTGGIISADMMMAALESPAIRSEVFQVITNTPHLLRSVARQEGATAPQPFSQSPASDVSLADENDAPVQLAGLFSSSKGSTTKATVAGSVVKKGSNFKQGRNDSTHKQPSAPSTAQRAISCPPPNVPFSPGAELWSQMLGASDAAMDEELQLFDAPPELPVPVAPTPPSPQRNKQLLSPTPIGDLSSCEPSDVEHQAAVLSLVHQVLLPHQVMSSGLSKQDFHKIAAEVTRVVMMQRKGGSPANSSATPAKAERRRIENLVDKYVERAQTQGAAALRRDPGPSGIAC